MGFRENLKNELAYSGMLVKELAARTGLNKYTIDNYLSAHNCSPSAEAAVKIAGVLGVTVEYLITGQEGPAARTLASLDQDLRSLIRAAESLPGPERKILVKNALNLAEILTAV